MTERLLNHIIDNIIKCNDYDVKNIIKEYIIPKYIDIKYDSIYNDYIELIEPRISTISLPRILKSIIKYFEEQLNFNSVRDSSIFAISKAYLQSIGDNQGLNIYDFEYAINRAGIIGTYTDEYNIFHCITIYDIIYGLVGDSWKNNNNVGNIISLDNNIYEFSEDENNLDLIFYMI